MFVNANHRHVVLRDQMIAMNVDNVRKPALQNPYKASGMSIAVLRSYSTVTSNAKMTASLRSWYQLVFLLLVALEVQLGARAGGLIVMADR